jgi:hypothetical protein
VNCLDGGPNGPVYIYIYYPCHSNRNTIVTPYFGLPIPRQICGLRPSPTQIWRGNGKLSLVPHNFRHLIIAITPDRVNQSWHFFPPRPWFLLGLIVCSILITPMPSQGVRNAPEMAKIGENRPIFA